MKKLLINLSLCTITLCMTLSCSDEVHMTFPQGPEGPQGPQGEAGINYMHKGFRTAYSGTGH